MRIKIQSKVRNIHPAEIPEVNLVSLLGTSQNHEVVFVSIFKGQTNFLSAKFHAISLINVLTNVIVVLGLSWPKR